jgi:signal transduction histidine kinase
MPAAVNADSGRIRQVLINLIGNAIKFTAKGSVTVVVSHTAADGGSLRVEVSDTGIGISTDQQERLFRRFSQANGSAATHNGGTGLGLAISKSLTELMGGNIGVKSRKGAGSMFWFTIAAPEVRVAESALEGGEISGRRTGGKYPPGEGHG